MQNEIDLTPLFQEFKPSNWWGKGEGKRIESCQKFENYLAAEGGREPYKVKNYDRATRFFQGLTDLHWLGRTNPSEKTIEVNVKGSASSFDVLRSLVYESAHADQHELIKTMEKADHSFGSEYNQALKRKELSDTDVIIMKWEYKHPLNLNHGNNYELQYIELDARQRSLKFLTQNYTLMGEEKDQYKHPQTNENVQTNFKDYLDVKGERELRIGKALVIDPSKEEPCEFERDSWLENRKDRGMFTGINNLSPTEQKNLRDIYLNDRGSMSDFGVLNRIRHWEREKRTCLDEAEKMKNGKVNKVTLEELEGKQQKEKRKSTHETTTSTLAKARNCAIL